MTIAFVIPVAWMMFASILDADGGFTLDNFRRLFASDYAMAAAWRSLRLSILQTVITMLLAIPLAYIMTRVTARLRILMLVIVILPLMTSIVVRTFGWVVLMGPNGLLGQIPGLKFLADSSQGMLGTEMGIVIAMVQVLLPFAVLTTVGVIAGIDPKVEEASRTLGASFLTTVRRVIVPLAVPGIAAGATLVFALSVSSFITPNLIGGKQLPVLANTIYVDATVNLDWPYAAAQAVLLFVGVFLVLAAVARLGKGKA
ncbi:ABC transporter permease [Yaniella flava]|uniref:ABC transporter permease n=1 Tax=Yaniella flava TaxID=287930 RepID=UPI0031D96376